MRQDPEWDESSAFFTNAASHRPKGSSRRSKENKENESKREVRERDDTLIRVAIPPPASSCLLRL